MRLPPPPLGPRGRLWVGYSGGCDSTVLLDLLHATGVPVRAVHVHHGLQDAADDWARQCRAFCRELGIPLRVLRVQPDAKHPQGPEAAARAVRYAALVRLLRSGDVLALAHHRDDQAETVLMRALRGSGIVGLGAMRGVEALGAGRLWRPLLSMPRDRLRDHARTRGLTWIEDPHNAQPRYARAFLREQVMPRLAAHFPSAGAQLASLAEHARTSAQLLAQLAALDEAACVFGDGLDIAALLALPSERRHNLLYHRWCGLGLLPPPRSWYAELERSVLRARADARPYLACGEGEARRHRNRLYLMRALPPPPQALVLLWSGRRQLELPDGCGSLRVSRLPPAGSEVHFASGGEKLQLAEDRGPRSLARLCQQAGVPSWWRERMPLLWCRGELLAAGGLWHAPAAQGLHIEWRHALPGARELSAGGSFT